MNNNIDPEMEERVKELKDEMLNFLIRRLKSDNESTEVIFNAVLNILAQIVYTSNGGDIVTIRDTADKVKSAMINYGVHNEKTIH